MLTVEQAERECINAIRIYRNAITACDRAQIRKRMAKAQLRRAYAQLGAAEELEKENLEKF